MVEEAEIVVVDYEDIITGSFKYEEEDNSNNKRQKRMLIPLQEKLEKAFGSSSANSIGIIAIRNVPNFVEAKQSLLRLAHPLAHLPNLKELEDPDSMYNTGWSHGKEMLKSGKADYAKGSFYFNPLVDIPGTAEERRRFPASYPCNVWPKESLPELEGAAKTLGCLMKDVAVHLSYHIDDYVRRKNPNYQPQTLYKHLVNTEKVKGRLLYYFPLPETNLTPSTDDDTMDKREETIIEKKEEDSWIGWHNDSGFLTALAGDMYLDEETGNEITSSDCDNDDKIPKISKSAGLYVVNRRDRVCKVTIPKDCMAIQIGECTQIITGGIVLATPHCVKGIHNIARTSLACFIDTPPSIPLLLPKPASVDNESFQKLSTVSSSKVPPLSARWNNGIAFGDFLQKTFRMYYEWKK